jgi:hypothetical protein
MLSSLDRFHKTSIGLILFVLGELALAYGFGSLAIDRGGIWWYFASLVLLLGGIQNLIVLIAKYAKR